MKFEGCVSLGSMSLLPDSRGEEEVKQNKKNKKNEQKQEVFRAVARTPNKSTHEVCKSERTMQCHKGGGAKMNGPNPLFLEYYAMD